MTFLINIIVRTGFVGLFALAAGIGSAWVMIHGGTRITVEQIGAWSYWPTVGRADADPYTRAHVVRLGLLPVNASLATRYVATHDGDGQRVHSACEYLIESETIDAQWWSLALYNEAGNIIDNRAARYAFNPGTVLLDADGGFSIVLSRDARPGNWLPTGGGGRLTLELTIQDARWVQGGGEAEKRKVLPTIRKVSCR